MTAALLALLLSGCAGHPPPLPLSDWIGNSEEMIAAIRGGLRRHAATITVRFESAEDLYDELNGAIDAWVEAALEETEDPREGDYIRYQYGGYTWTSSRTCDGGVWSYTVELRPDYYSYLSQEEQVTEAVDAALEELSFGDGTAGAEKIAAIYDGLCRTVSYDKVHRKNPYYHSKSTAYAALVRHSATCQGYCAALYRLLRESGIDCRIVTGQAVGEYHAWVIAAVDGQYYGLDPTWDAGAEEYRYLLVGSAEFADHIPAERFRSRDFNGRYPMAKDGYWKEGLK